MMKLIKILLVWGIFCAPLFAEDIQIVGSKKITVKEQSSSNNPMQLIKLPLHTITLLQLSLSGKAKEHYNERARAVYLSQNSDVSMQKDAAKSVQLGMNNVPVLDQGRFGSCVTFANTAAIDAALKKGDYISQLCQLQLGRFLEKNGYNPSGWDGSWGGVVLNQMMSYGLVNKAQQQAQGCGGLTQYPMNGNPSSLGSAMTPEEYHSLSESMQDAQVAWSYIADVYQLIYDKMDPEYVLAHLKTTLEAGDRTTFAVLLPAVDQGMAGALGTFHASNDSWVLTKEVMDDFTSATEFAGHEMVITGYDDNAIATDNHGKQHRGLLTLRNSWSDRVGDKGNFYMSYDYFKTLVMEVIRIRHVD